MRRTNVGANSGDGLDTRTISGVSNMSRGDSASPTTTVEVMVSTAKVVRETVAQLGAIAAWPVWPVVVPSTTVAASTAVVTAPFNLILCEHGVASTSLASGGM